ncbi:MAG: BrnT family toxin [Acetobacteraceae bacterium]|jgi:uncharacterized DUF497 family protein
MTHMNFGWDPPKSDRNVRERGLPFEVAMALFDRNTIEFDDTRKNCGERRIIAFGEVAGRLLVGVYTWRSAADRPLRWIISLRRANQGETNAYRRTFPQ